MKKVLLTMIGLFLLVFALSGISYGWQGRMGGMGDPFGLVADESDYLIHPAKIANGEGVRFYGDYRFTFTGVTDWDNEINIFTPAGILNRIFPKETSGNELRHEALLGSSFPLGPGRMGFFFTYAGMRGDYDGKQNQMYAPSFLPQFFDTYDLRSDLDNFAFRLLYGLPVGSFNLGGEVQIAYRQEENEALFNADEGGGSRSLFKNRFAGGIPSTNIYFSFMMPYDSRYWEALFKGSLEGKVGPLDLEFTLRGGFVFGGDNQYEYEVQNPIGTPFQRLDLNGDVSGWCAGGNLWVRYPVAQDITLPFMVSIDYREKTRDGDGTGLLGLSGNYSYKNQEQSLHLKLGGGMDKELPHGAKIAAGIYYNYRRGNNEILFMEPPPPFANWTKDDYNGYPVSDEHQVMIQLAGELVLSPVVSLRMGLAPFYGWVREDFKASRITLYLSPTGSTDEVSTDGYHWGVGASMGGTIKLKPITLEPFINFGYQQLHLKGRNGDTVVIPTGFIINLYNMSIDRNEWSIGGGVSILYDL